MRMEAAVGCPSDIHVMHGTAILPLPVVRGHEVAETVEEVDPGVTRVKPGDRCIMSFVSNYGHCRSCRIESPQLCDTNAQMGALQYDGAARLHDDGADVYQMAKVAIIAPRQACQVIPDGVPWALPR